MLVLTSLLSACGASQSTPIVAATEPTPSPPEAITPAPLALTLGQLSLRSMDAPTTTPPRVARPPMTVEMVDDAGHLTATRCGATSLSADGVLRRDDAIVARLEPTTDGFALHDGAGHDTSLVLRGNRIESTAGELRFRRDGSSIVSPDGEVPTIEITPPTANLDTALALFATLLVCNDLGP